MDEIKIILDTDLGSDCDDAGALAVLHNLANHGKAKILAVTHCTSEKSGAVMVKAVNEWYKRPDIPVGQYNEEGFLVGGVYRRYTGCIMEKYLSKHDMPVIEDAVKVLRRTLAENDNVVIVVIGMLNNIANLLKSSPDEISPLDGVELVREKVNCMYVMGGHFKDSSYSEFNIVTDVKSAKYVSERFPMPIVYCGFELGENVLTGESLRDSPMEHPVRMAYSIWSKAVFGSEKLVRCSWDPITVYCAIEQDNNLYEKSSPKSITFDDKGRVVMADGGKDCYMIAKQSEDAVIETLQKLII